MHAAYADGLAGCVVELEHGRPHADGTDRHQAPRGVFFRPQCDGARCVQSDVIPDGMRGETNRDGEVQKTNLGALEQTETD
jgi:hypothetical protein